MSDNLKDAAESGFRVYGEKIQAPFSNEDLTGLLEAYTSRILALQQAAHNAEIAKLKEEFGQIQGNQALLIRDYQAQLSASQAREAALTKQRDEYISITAACRDVCGDWQDHPEAMGDPAEVPAVVKRLRERADASERENAELRKRIAELEQRVKALTDAKSALFPPLPKESNSPETDLDEALRIQ